jgi:hypothetical protein
VKYVILMYTDPDQTRAMTPEERAEIVARHDAIRQLVETGEVIGGAGLAFPEETTTLRWDGPTTTGPLVAGTVQLSAYYVVECDTAARAHEIAAQTLDYHVLVAEVRAVHDWLPGPGA